MQLTNDAGRFVVSPRAFQREEEVRTATVGLRNWFSTGSVGHTLNLSLNRFDMTFDNSGARYANGVSNLFDRKHYTQAFRCAAGRPDAIYPETGRAFTASVRVGF